MQNYLTFTSSWREREKGKQDKHHIMCGIYEMSSPDRIVDSRYIGFFAPCSILLCYLIS